MSGSAFSHFVQQVQQDAGLKRELRAAGGEAGMPIEQLIAFAAARGYPFEVEDVTSELSEEQLDGVAGGWGDPHIERPQATARFLKIDGVSSYPSPTGDLMVKMTL